jgi:hypothetical protein
MRSRISSGSSTIGLAAWERISPISHSGCRRHLREAVPSVSGVAPRSSAQRAATSFAYSTFAVRASRSRCGSNAWRGVERSSVSFRAAHAVEAEAALAVARAVPRVTSPVGQLALERVRLDDALRPRLLAFLLVLDLDQVRSRIASVSVATRSLPRHRACGSGVCASSNWPNVSSSFFRTRSSGVCASAAIIGPTNSSARPDRARLERCQARGKSEGVTVQLLVDMDAFALERGVDGVAAPAEVDEVEELQMLLELILGNVEALDDLPRGDILRRAPHRMLRAGMRGAPAARRNVRGQTGPAARSPTPSARVRRRGGG